MFGFWKKDRKPINTIEQVVDVLPRVYSDKGVSNVPNINPKNPWTARITIDNRHKRKNGAKHDIHIGYFATKEEAQKARWEFIENLK